MTVKADCIKLCMSAELLIKSIENTKRTHSNNYRNTVWRLQERRRDEVRWVECRNFNLMRWLKYIWLMLITVYYGLMDDINDRLEWTGAIVMQRQNGDDASFLLELFIIFRLMLCSWLLFCKNEWRRRVTLITPASTLYRKRTENNDLTNTSLIIN